MMCHATQMLLDDTFCRSDDPSSNASLASEKTFGKKVVGRKRNQQQHISSAHDCRLGALLWHQMVDRRSTWGKSDSFCQPADLGWPKTISPLRMTTILIVSYTKPSHHTMELQSKLALFETKTSLVGRLMRQDKAKTRHVCVIHANISKVYGQEAQSCLAGIWVPCTVSSGRSAASWKSDYTLQRQSNKTTQKAEILIGWKMSLAA